MPRPTNHAAHVTASVEELLRAVTRLVASIGEALTAGRAEQVAAVLAARAAGKAPLGQPSALWDGAKRRRHGKALAASWARYTPAQRRARIAKMKAGHARSRRARGTA